MSKKEKKPLASTLLKSLFATRLHVVALNDADTLPAAVRELAAHHTLEALRAPTHARLADVWCAKLAALLVPRALPRVRLAGLALLALSAPHAPRAALPPLLERALAVARAHPDELSTAERACATLAAAHTAIALVRGAHDGNARRSAATSASKAAHAALSLLDNVALAPADAAVSLAALAAVLRAVPGAVRAHVARAEALTLRWLLTSGTAGSGTDAALRKRAAACVALLPATAGADSSVVGGVAPSGAPLNGDDDSTCSHAALSRRLVSIAHASLDIAFACAAEPSSSAQLRSTDAESDRALAERVCGKLPTQVGAAGDALHRRVAGAYEALGLLLRVTGGRRARVVAPIRAALAVALRALALDGIVSRPPPASLAASVLLTRHEATRILPALQAAALKLIAALLDAAPTVVLPHARQIADTLIATLARSATPRAADAAAHALQGGAGGSRRASAVEAGDGAHSKLLFAPTRVLAYAAIRRLVAAGGWTIDVRYFVAPVLAHAASDVRPPDSVLTDDVDTVSATNETVSGNSSAKKRKRTKMGGTKSDAALVDADTAFVRDFVPLPARTAAVWVLSDLMMYGSLALSSQQESELSTAIFAAASSSLAGQSFTGDNARNSSAAYAAHFQQESSAATTTNTISVVTRECPPLDVVAPADFRKALAVALGCVADSVRVAEPAARALLAELRTDAGEHVRHAVLAQSLRRKQAPPVALRTPRIVRSGLALATSASINADESGSSVSESVATLDVAIADDSLEKGKAENKRRKAVDDLQEGEKEETDIAESERTGFSKEITDDDFAQQSDNESVQSSESSVEQTPEQIVLASTEVKTMSSNNEKLEHANRETIASYATSTTKQFSDEEDQSDIDSDSLPDIVMAPPDEADLL